jgi:hypothetical protein
LLFMRIVNSFGAACRVGGAFRHSPEFRSL